MIQDIEERTTPAADRVSVQVYLGPRSYEIFIVSGRLAAMPLYVVTWLEGRAAGSLTARRALIVTDRNVADWYAAPIQRSLTEAGWRCELHAVEPGEPSKSLEQVEQVYDRLVAMGADRHTVVLAVGGGVVGDLAGFVAATYARGIPFVQVPTSLLAQVDSAVGGKVGVNHPKAKNLIGAFHQPMGVLIDTTTLDTLPDRDYRSGLAEVVKYGMILDGEFFEFLEQNTAGVLAREDAVLRRIIARCCRLKADVVEEDELDETGVRSVLNYGHTFGHAFEALCGYGTLMHGEAVAIGMVCAARLAARRGLIGRDIVERQHSLLEALGVPTRLPKGAGVELGAVLERMRLDKKSVGGRLAFVLPRRIGLVSVFRDVGEGEVREALAAAL
ncbi:MAG: 3-dehydroquinate synthase [Planctomycetes bacterium]|nr:3-dehydroquinate synthase [Planctomycetota bacterium]